MMKPNKVFQVELCQEDAQRIILALDSYSDKCEQLIDQCDSDAQKDTAHLEYTYVRELMYYLEDIFDLSEW